MLIQRKEYLDKLIAFKDKQLIKIVTGIRRCGKSTLLTLYQDWLRSQGVSDEQIIIVDFGYLDYIELRDYKKLYEYLHKCMVTDKMNYIFIDEVQDIDNYPKLLAGLYVKENVDIYITGSSEHILSGDTATLISGRYVQIEMLPFSFKEYMESTGSMSERGSKFREYLERSSFPYAIKLQDQPKELRNYLEGLYNTIVVNDIVSLKKVTDTAILHSILRYLFDHIGIPLSSKKIADALTANGNKVDTKTVDKYLEALTESYVIYPVKRYDIKGNQHLKTLERYYLVDLGLRLMLHGTEKTETGQILENVVYLELLRRGYQVSTGKIGEFEVDFVAKNSKGTTYIQVVPSVREERMLERELRIMNMIKDHYPKLILTLDDDPEAQYDGIRRVNVRDWLLNLTE